MIGKVLLLSGIIQSSNSITTLIGRIQAEMMELISPLISALARTKEETFTIPVDQIVNDAFRIELGTSCDSHITYCT